MPTLGACFSYSAEIIVRIADLTVVKHFGVFNVLVTMVAWCAGLAVDGEVLLKESLTAPRWGEFFQERRMAVIGYPD